ncbi:hybrid sensor histidine kinase/response regulator [Kordia sp.]|uniref:hybrid sensor histidine kinase/response regulator n=1 Tax=Kordia sp. TaxID=1965332 RepID=UPI003D6A8BBE
MKRLYFLLFTFALHSFALAQNTSNTLLDSMLAEKQRAFKLFEQGKHGEAITINNKVLKYAKEANDSILMGRCYASLGNSHYFVSKDSLSFYYLFKARDIFERAKDTFNLVLSYNDIGVNYKDFDSIPKANMYFTKAINLAKAGGYEIDMIYPLSNVAENKIYLEQNYTDGITYSLETLGIMSKIPVYDDRKLKALIYVQLSYAYYKINDLENHQLYFNKSVEASKKYNHIGVLVKLYKEQAELFRKDNNLKKAYDFMHKHALYNDSLNKIKEYEKAKQIEADNFLRENREKVRLLEAKQEFKDATITKFRTYNTILAFFILGLLISIYLIFKKNKQLNATKKEAEELSKAKSDFYSEISHELRTPLYGVIELSKLLLKENVNSSHKEYLESLNFSASHLLSLINNVLELNKIESGKIKLEVLDFKPKDLINNIVDSLEFALVNSQNKIHIEYDDRIPTSLKGDSLKLSQVFINLISNAIKFTHNGNIYVKARLLEDLNENVKIHFEVQDNGSGISKTKQEQIFEKFYQEQTKFEKSYKGTGLGLSIVKRILKVMQSDIVIESEVDKGTSFSFELVFDKKETVKLQNNTCESISKAIAGKYILIVDDNKINQLVTKKILDEYKVNTKVVGSGKQAISALKETSFDCILMDLHMPDLDGYKTTSIIREFNTEIPIIALTASSSEEVEQNISKYAMNGHIMKPFLTADFITTIHKTITS